MAKSDLPYVMSDTARPCFEQPDLVCFEDPASRSLWLTQRPSERPCFTPATLAELQLFYEQVRAGTTFEDPQWLVYASQPREIYSLGGDLRYFARCIRDNDRPRLLDYARRCVDIVRTMHEGVDGRLLTVTMLQGEALGGGFEAVLATDFVVAEEQARAGLPEVLFGLFPGMGALSFLIRRIGERQAVELVRSGRILDAAALLGLGLVDEVVPCGQGPARVRALLRQRSGRQRTLRTIRQAAQRVQAPSPGELVEIVELWVDAALALDEYDLRKLEKIAGAQERMWARVDRKEAGPPWRCSESESVATGPAPATIVAVPARHAELEPTRPAPEPTSATANTPLSRRLAIRLDAEVDRFIAHGATRALLAGEVDRGEAERFALAVALTHLCSPQVFALIYSLAPTDTRYALDNLREELGDEGGGHPAMFRPLFDALGYSAAARVRIAAAAWRELQREFTEVLPYRTIGEWGLALLLEVGAFEWMLAREAAPLGDALRRGLKVEPAAVQWFEHHAVADQAHAEQFLGAVDSYVAAYGLDAGTVGEIVEQVFVRNVFVRWYVESSAAATLLAELGR